MELVNQPIRDYTGKTLEELKDWRSVIHQDDWALMADLWLRSVQTGNPFHTEFRVRRADGVYRWFDARALPLRDSEGRILRWYGLYTDIEGRKQVELNFRLTIDSIPGFVCTETPAAGVELVNRQFLDYTGKTFEEVQQWAAAGLIHEDDLTRVIDHWGYTRETGQPHDIEYRVRAADGVFRWFHVRGLPSRDSSQGIVRWYYLFTDIEGRKQAEQALRASEHHLRLISETIPALVWRTTADGEIDYVNQRVLDYTGKPLEYFGHRPGWLQLLHPDDVDSTMRLWQHNTQTGNSHQVAYRLRRADGEYRWFDVRGEPLRDGEGRVIQWYGLCIDIEDSKRIEEQLRSTQERFVPGVADRHGRRRLSAAIAHEINQPLTAVVSNGNACLRWISAHPPNLAKAMEAAERIVRDGKDAGEIIRRVRALFKRASLEKDGARHERSALEEVLPPDSKRGGSQGRRPWRPNWNPNLPCVAGDRVQLQQLLLNLLVNGMEAMEGVADQPKRLFIRSTQEADEGVLIEVRDCGSGLAEPNKAFEAFFTTKENGLGMGLAICRSIVEAHHGRLWAASVNGAGATFRFTLPSVRVPRRDPR